jgi:hypothetical protein
VASTAERVELARLVGRLNKALEGRNFVLMGPGRWGSANLQLGVPVSYADIYNARSLVELSVGPEGLAPDPSYGTHFFQDLVESQIYSLAVHTNGKAVEEGEFVNWEFLRGATDRLASLLPDLTRPNPCLKLIDVAAERNGQKLEVWMDGEKALGFFSN